MQEVGPPVGAAADPPRAPTRSSQSHRPKPSVVATSPAHVHRFHRPQIANTQKRNVALLTCPA